MKKLFKVVKKKIKFIFNFIKKYKKRILMGLGIFLIIFMTAFTYINLTNPTEINKYIASVVNTGNPANNYFDDQIFYNVVIDAYNKENNTTLPYTTNLTDEQLKTIKFIYYEGFKKSNYEKISNVKGIEKLTSLTRLVLSSNRLTSVDVSKNIKLTYLRLSNNQLTSIDVSKNVLLNELYLDGNKLTSIDVSKNTSLTHLDVDRNQLTSIDVSNNTTLTRLGLSNNQLTSVDVSKNTALTYLDLLNNQLTSVDVSKNTTLKILDLHGNQLTSIDLSENVALTRLVLSSNRLTSVDVSNNTALGYLNLSNNQLTSIDVSKNTSLTHLVVGINQLTSIDLNTALTYLYLSNNQLTSIDLSENVALTRLVLSSNRLTSVDVSNNTALGYLNLSNNQLTSIDLSKNTALTDLYLPNNQLTNINLSNNTKLEDLDLRNNNFINKLYLRKDQIYTLPIILPEQLKNRYVISDSNVASFDNNIITGLKVGATSTTLDSTISNININVYDITSEKYIINNEKKYIYTKNDVDSNIILSNLNLENINGKIENNKFILYDINYGVGMIDEYDIVNTSSTTYDLTKNYIYVGTGTLDVSKINVTNGMLEKKDNRLNIKYNNDVLDIYNIASISSTRYNLNKDYIYTVDEDVNLDLINTINCDKKIENNKVVIYKGEDVLKEYDIVKIDLSNSEYDLSKEYIYLGTSDFDPSKINTTNITSVIENNILYLKYQGDTIKEYKLIKVLSDQYEINNNNIFIYSSYDKDNINVTNGTFEVSNNIVTIKYNEEILDTYRIVGLTSTKYDLTKDYIYVRTDKLDKTLINTANVTLEEENNKLKVLYEDEVIKEYDIISISSEDYDLSNEYFYNKDIDINKINVINGTLEEVSNAINIKYNNEIIDSIKLIRLTSEEYTIGDDYIFIGNNEFDNSKINVINGSFEVNNNTLNIKYNDQIIDTYKIVGYKSNTYDLSKEYIYTNSFDNTKINYINCTGNINNNILEIKYNNEVLDSKKIISISSEKYDLTKDYIYLGVNELDLSKITVTNANLETKDNNLNIKYNDEIVKSYKLIMISSNVYDLNKEYIYTKNNSFNSNSISIINGSISVSDNVLNIKYNDQVIDSRNIVSISSTKYDLSKEYIYVGINTFNKNNVVCIKCNLEITNNNLNIKYEDEIIDTYKIASISSDKYDLTKDKIKIKKDVFSIDDITSINCEKEYIGNKLYIKYNNEILKEYTLYTRITGDVTGDDKITLSDVSRLFKHVRGKQIITDEETLSACDVTGDGKITLSDVSKLFKYVRGKIPNL